MKSFLLPLCLLLSATIVKAQTHLLGIKGGFTSTSANVEFYNATVNKSRGGITAGITYEYISKSGASLFADLLYSPRGYRNDFNYDGLPPFGGPVWETAYNVLTPYTYIALPLRGGFNFGRALYGFVNAGFVPALLLHSESPYFIRDSNGLLVEQGTVDVTHKKNRFDFAVIAEGGIGYRFKNESRVFTSVSYQQSASDANGGRGYGAVKHNGLTLAFGIKWALPQRVPAGETGVE